MKRFSFALSDNTATSFISEGKGSYLVDLSDDLHPQFQVVFGGRQENREPENFDAEEFIGKKGVAAKGKKCHSLDVKKVLFIEPLHKPEDDIVPDAESEPENLAGEIDLSEILDIDNPDEAFSNLEDIPEDIEEPTLF